MGAQTATLTWIDVVSLAGSVASIILAVFAIGLSVVFFVQSSRWSRAFDEAAREISHNVRRLETLFDKLYSDTFTMMKDTVGDIRKHAWSGETAASKRDLTGELNEQLAALETRLAERVDLVTMEEPLSAAQRAQVEELLKDAVAGTQQINIEVPRAVSRRVLVALLNRAKPLTVEHIVEQMGVGVAILDVLAELRDEGLVETVPSGWITPRSTVTLTTAGLQERTRLVKDGLIRSRSTWRGPSNKGIERTAQGRLRKRGD